MEWCLSQDPHFSYIMFYIIYLYQIFGRWNCDLVVLFCTSIPPSVTLPEVCSIFFSLLKGFLFQRGKFFLYRKEGLRTDCVIHCTYCKAHWGDVIVHVHSFYWNAIKPQLFRILCALFLTFSLPLPKSTKRTTSITSSFTGTSVFS